MESDYDYWRFNQRRLEEYTPKSRYSVYKRSNCKVTLQLRLKSLIISEKIFKKSS